MFKLVGGTKKTARATPTPTASSSVKSTASSSSSSCSGRSVSALLPMHGPVVTTAVSQLTCEYRSWAEAQVKAASTSCATVLYASAYGNTAALAQVWR